MNFAKQMRLLCQLTEKQDLYEGLAKRRRPWYRVFWPRDLESENTGLMRGIPLQFEL